MTVEAKSEARIDARKDGAIGWLIFDNPARRNAVSLGMWEAIPRVLEDFGADPAIRVVVLAGAGDRAFVSGADVAFLAAVATPAVKLALDGRIAAGSLLEKAAEPA